LLRVKLLRVIFFKCASCQALELSSARAVSAHSDGDTATTETSNKLFEKYTLNIVGLFSITTLGNKYLLTF